MSYVDCSQLFRVSEKRQIYILLDCLRRRSVDRRCFNKLGMSFILAIDFPIGAEYALKNCNGGTLAMISKDFWNVLNVECNGRLRTGESVKKVWNFFNSFDENFRRYINGGDSNCNCFKKISGPFGPKGNRLRPYISIGK